MLLWLFGYVKLYVWCWRISSLGEKAYRGITAFLEAISKETEQKQNATVPA